ncbi:MAG TPA: 4-aminobutyrate--2-oxoglutarate transaminase [Candidatus Marinimicrobia bacterium]|nr:4-aminobutyrate--2-oxoglutarate transaminase [Candidatus Neomarinimicrobiota bacterium]
MEVRIKTPIPGPRSIELSQLRALNVAQGHGSVCGIFIARAEGANLVDVDGNIFIDYAGGIGTINVGHSHPKVLAAMKDQIDQFVHPCFTVAPYEPYVSLATKLSKRVPISGSCKAVFFNSGAEAVENAVKIAKSYTGRKGILVFSHAFHGRTLMAMSMTYKEDPYKKGFGPFVPNIHRLEFPSENVDLDLNNLEFDPRTIACTVIEPVAGEGGFIPASKDAMAKLRKFCTQHDIVMVADEVQSGFGRTGTLFAMEQFGVEPDLITLAKSIAGGLPLSSVIGRSDLMDSAHIGGIGGTFGGNPVACAAALAVLEVMDDEQLPERANEIGKKVRSKVESLKDKCPWIGGVRGLGAMIGVIIVDPETGAPDKKRTSRIHKYALEHGLVMITAGTDGNIIRTLMPLTIKDDILDQSLDILLQAIVNA